MYSVDGAVVATQNTAIGTSMRGVVRDNTPGGTAVLVNWLRLTPVRPDRDVHLACASTAGPPSCGTARRGTPACRRERRPLVRYRTGNSANPNTSWSGYTTLGSSGASINVRSRYIQYQVVMTTASPTLSPSFNDITMRYGA